MCEGIFSVYVIIKFKIQRILDAFIYSKYPDQRKHVTTESGSADLAGGDIYRVVGRLGTRNITAFAGLCLKVLAFPSMSLFY